MGNFVDGERRTTAGSDAVWDLLADVDRWPDTFTPHLRAAHLEGPLEVGATGWVKTKLPLPRSRFEVIALEPRRSWAWRGRVLWLTMTFDHVVDPTDSGATVRFDVDLDGALASIVRPVFRLVYRPNMNRALDALVAAAERSTDG